MGGAAGWAVGGALAGCGLGLLLAEGAEAGVAADEAWGTASRGIGEGTNPTLGTTWDVETNAAGGEVWTSNGVINQDSFRELVFDTMINSDEELNILTGVDGSASGRTVQNILFYIDDMLEFGAFPRVNIYFLPVMSDAEINAVLDGPGIIVAAFCNSGFCL